MDGKAEIVAHKLHNRRWPPSSLFMKELLHRPATEFGLYFAMMPIASAHADGRPQPCMLAKHRQPVERMP
jgi:hypothetical protein